QGRGRKPSSMAHGHAAHGSVASSATDTGSVAQSAADLLQREALESRANEGDESKEQGEEAMRRADPLLTMSPPNNESSDPAATSDTLSAPHPLDPQRELPPYFLSHAEVDLLYRLGGGEGALRSLAELEAIGERFDSVDGLCAELAKRHAA